MTCNLLVLQMLIPGESKRLFEPRETTVRLLALCGNARELSCAEARPSPIEVVAPSFAPVAARAVILKPFAPTVKWFCTNLCPAPFDAA